MSESAAAVLLKNSEETVYSGYLVKGEERKQGTQVAFKDKKRYYVLRCLGNKLLTMTAYKDEKDFRNLGRKGKVANENRFMESYNARVKVHKLQMEVRKHKTADILCIVQDKRPLYLETSSRADLDSWYSSFNSILVQLGWKEPSPDEHRPMSYPPTNQKSSTDQVNGDRYSTPSAIENAFQEEPQSPPCNVRVTDVNLKRISGHSPHHDIPATPPRSPSLINRNSGSLRSVPIEHNHDHDHSPDKPCFCCQRHHVIGTGAVTYINLHPIENVGKWEKDVAIRRERLVNVKDFYSEYVGPPPPLDYIQHHRISTERRRSKSTSDVTNDIKEWQQKQKHGSKLWDPPEVSSSDEDAGPVLPIRKPIPKRRSGKVNRPSDLDYSINPPPLPGQESHYQYPTSPPVSSPLANQFTEGYPSPPSLRHHKLSEPNSPHHIYINTAEANTYPSGPPTPPRVRRPKNTSLVDLSRRPLPSPTDSGRPSSFVANLHWEQSLYDGFPITVPKEDLEDTLALVKIADYVWVAGKKRGCQDSISSRFHVGDQLRQINDQIVVDVTIAHALFRTTAKEEVILQVKRLPYAKVFKVKRTSADVAWGLRVEGNKVLDVPKTGPAADAGINARPEGALSKRLCSWIVTHINAIPVSLSCSKDEVRNRLDNTDLEMSIILQPEDFITKLKSELQNVKFSIDYI